MLYADYVASIRHDGARIVDAARAAGIDAAVPTCPNWTITDLLAHLGLIQHWVTDIVRTRPGNPADHWRQHEPPAASERRSPSSASTRKISRTPRAGSGQ